MPSSILAKMPFDLCLNSSRDGELTTLLPHEKWNLAPFGVPSLATVVPPGTTENKATPQAP